MLKLTQPNYRIKQGFQVWFNPHLVTSNWKSYANRREIYRANWTGRPGKLTQPINWNGTRRPVNSHPNATELKFQRNWAQSHLYTENLKQPDSYFKEMNYPDVTTMDGVLPRYIDFPSKIEAKDLLKKRLDRNRSVNRFLDEEWKHLPDERAKFSWLDFQSSNPKIFFDVMDVVISSFDRNRVEHYHDYMEKLCRYCELNVTESYALPNEKVTYKVYDENNVLQPTDQLTRHYRVIQITDMDVLQLNTITSFARETIPESVELEIKKHDIDTHNQRYQRRVDIENAQRDLEMLSKMK